MRIRTRCGKKKNKAAKKSTVGTNGRKSRFWHAFFLRKCSHIAERRAFRARHAMPEKVDNKTIFSLLEVTQNIQKTLSDRYQSSFWVNAEMNKLHFYKRAG